QSEYLRQVNHLQSSLNLEHGPLLRLAYISSGPEMPDKLLIIIHHLTIDGVSWRILLEDFQNAYQQLRDGQEIHLPEKTSSFKEWAEKLQKYARSDKIRSELNYWLSTTAGEDGDLPCDFNKGENTRDSQRFFKTKLTKEDTQKLLKQLPGALQTNMDEVLLGALSTTLSEWTGNNTIYIDLESHGREEIGRAIDVSRTVGWFTSIFPLRLEINDPANIQDSLLAVKKQFRSIPDKGIGYGLLRYLSSSKEVENQFNRRRTPQLSLNYLGQIDSVFEQNTDFRISEKNRGIEIYPGALRTHLIEIECMVLKGQLIIEWVYSINYHRQATIEKLAYRFIEYLQQLIQLADSMQEKQYLPSDFPLAGLDQKKLEKLASLIDKDDHQGKDML
ncbi:MAG: condensation domain-containing protein, partial [Calditrichia bacterium]